MTNELMIKGVTGFENLYLAFEDGRVFSTRKQVFIKPHLSPNGYYKLNICYKGQVWSKPVHRLIAEAFISNPENKPQINHKNGIKTDNRVVNLEWCTRSENIQHSVNDIKTFPLGEARSESKLKSKDIPLIRMLEKTGVNQKVIAKFFKVSCPTINKIVNGKMWKHVA